MSHIQKKPIDRLGYDFIPSQYLPEGKDEYYIREEQFKYAKKFRNLTAYEIEVLVKNKNSSDDWNAIYVTDKFDPQFVQGCKFYGKIRIGALEPVLLEFHDLRHPVGLYNSTIISCDLGDNVVLDNVNIISHYQIGDECMLLNINEMLTTNYAKFGNGILKEGEEEKVRVWLELCNENGGRKILGFNGMLAGDAYLWSKYRDDQELMNRFKAFTTKRFDVRRGAYGTVGSQTIIKNCKIIKDVKIGESAYIKGANKLKNLTINSSKEAISQIGEGVELVNGIMSYGCRIFYGVKAVRFFMGSHSALKYGARLINSYLGNNATISCCEVLNSLIFPGHEQHHNNSFLCAAVVQGQSNIAAGATIGSNHNSRGNDGEIVANRGFWPGLCVSLKHNSKFAAYTLIAKGDYPAEIDLKVPFTLVFNDESTNSLKLLPAYWFMHNMYAIARNAWKYRVRDMRLLKKQLIEYNYLAPDTVNEIIDGMKLMELWTAKSYYKSIDKNIATLSEEEIYDTGRDLLLNKKATVAQLEIVCDKVESSSRKVILLKAHSAYRTFNEMLLYYAVTTLVEYIKIESITSLDELKTKLKAINRDTWINVGGQLIQASDIHRLKEDIKNGEINTWDEVHIRYKTLGANYKHDKANHALITLLEIAQITIDQLDEQTWYTFVVQSVEIKNKLADLTYLSRLKDYENPFRKITYDNPEEMEAVIGKIEDNDFIAMMRKEADNYIMDIEELKKTFTSYNLKEVTNQ